MNLHTPDSGSTDTYFTVHGRRSVVFLSLSFAWSRGSKSALFSLQEGWLSTRYPTAVITIDAGSIEMPAWNQTYGNKNKLKRKLSSFWTSSVPQKCVYQKLSQSGDYSSIGCRRFLRDTVWNWN